MAECLEGHPWQMSLGLWGWGRLEGCRVLPNSLLPTPVSALYLLPCGWQCPGWHRSAGSRGLCSAAREMLQSSCCR